KYYVYFIVINIFGIVILSIICTSQIDIKLIITISSIVHTGIITIGILLMTKIGLYGRYYIIISHGFVSSGLFYLTNFNYLKTNRRLF
ncbi:unnamed protein product, partial [Heterotrigona itama]